MFIKLKVSILREFKWGGNKAKKISRLLFTYYCIKKTRNTSFPLKLLRIQWLINT